MIVVETDGSHFDQSIILIGLPISCGKMSVMAFYNPETYFIIQLFCFVVLLDSYFILTFKHKFLSAAIHYSVSKGKYASSKILQLLF